MFLFINYVPSYWFKLTGCLYFGILQNNNSAIVWVILTQNARNRLQSEVIALVMWDQGSVCRKKLELSYLFHKSAIIRFVYVAFHNCAHGAGSLLQPWLFPRERPYRLSSCPGKLKVLNKWIPTLMEQVKFIFTACPTRVNTQ